MQVSPADTPPTQEPSITLTAKISFWSQYRATRAVTNRLWNTWLAWGFFVGVPLLLTVVTLCQGQDLSMPGTFGLPVWMNPLAGLAFMGGLMPLLQMLNVSTLRRRSASAGGVQTYTISPRSYTVQGSLFDTTLKWEAFLKAVETKEFILLYVSARGAHFIPKVAATAEELSAIRMIIGAALGGKAKLQTSWLTMKRWMSR